MFLKDTFFEVSFSFAQIRATIEKVIHGTWFVTGRIWVEKGNHVLDFTKNDFWYIIYSCAGVFISARELVAWG